MKMGKTFWACLLSLSVCILFLGAFAQAAVKDSHKTPKEDPNKAPAGGDVMLPPSITVTVTGADNTFQLIDSECTPTDAQKPKITKLAEDRDKALKKWDDDNSARLDKIRTAIDAAKTAGQKRQLNEQLASVQSQRDLQETNWDRKAIVLLKADQKLALFTRQLTDIMTEEFKSVSLTQDEQDKLKEVCAAKAKQSANSSPDVRSNKMLLKSMAGLVFSKVLSADQKQDYAKSKRAAMEPALGGTN